MNPDKATGVDPFRNHAVLVLAVCVLVSVVWSSALAAGFVFDDFLFLDQVSCWQIDRWSELPGVTSHIKCSYRKLRYLSLAVDHILWGRDPWGYHLTNLLLHIATTALVLTLMRRWVTNIPLAVGATLLWALHPVHADTVTYISGRRDLLTTLFFVASVLLWPTDWRRLSRAGLRAGAAAITFALAMLSKEMAVTLPAIIVVISWFQHRSGAPDADRSVARMVAVGVRALPWVVPVIAVAGWSVWFRGISHSGSNASGWHGGDPGTHVLTMLAVYGRYLELIVWPWRLIGDYQDFRYAFSLADVRIWPGVAFLAATWLGGGVLAWRGRPAGVGLLWFALTMLPISQILVHHELMAEHYLYLPMIGLALALGVALDPFCERTSERARWLPQRGVQAALVVVVVLLSWKVQVRNADFADNMTFRQAMLEHVPHSFRGRRALASEYAKAGDLESAAALLQQLVNEFGPTTPEHAAAAGDLAQIRADRGELDAAVQLVEASLTVAPDVAAVLALRGSLHLQMGEPAAAVPVLERATGLNPERLQWQIWLAMALSGSGRSEDALTLLQAQSEIHSGAFLLHMVTGDTLAGAGRLPEAVQHYEHAAHADPASPAPWQRLAAVWEAMQQPERAQQAANRAQSLGSRTP
jgi:tetratricopeptide (TPR) repeat protein